MDTGLLSGAATGAGEERPGPPSALGRVLFLITWAVSAVYALAHLDVGWFPADAGTLGQSAERVLLGELPHRDFQDPYTGGLAMLYAAGFQVLGVGVMSMRWVTYGVFLVWIPAFWALASRFAGPATVALATVLAASWTLPIYAEGMPSWYNLFFATFGALALLRFRKSRSRVWLVAAGFAGGLSVLAKIVGLYYVAAAGVFLLYDAATPPDSGRVAASSADDRKRGGDVGFRILALGVCVALAAAVSGLVLRAMGARHFFLYGVPPLAGITPIAWAVGGARGRPTSASMRALAGTVVPLTIGLAVPILAFSLPYVATGSTGDLIRGVFVRPTGRLESVGMIGPAGYWWSSAPALLLLSWLAVSGRGPAGGRVWWLGAGAAALGAVLLGSGSDPIYVGSFRTLLWLSPLVTLVAAVVVTRPVGERRDSAFLMVALYGLTSLVQVPFAAPTYFFYAAPLGILVALAVLGRTGSRVAGTRLILAALIAFTVLRLNHGFTLDIGFRYRPDALSATLTLPRAMGLRVPPEDKSDYEGVLRLLNDLGGGDELYAGPDAPELYFLSGLRNPLPTLYEVLGDGDELEPRVLAVADRPEVRAIVIRPRPLFSPALPVGLIQELERRFPNGRQIGRFIVAWRGE